MCIDPLKTLLRNRLSLWHSSLFTRSTVSTTALRTACSRQACAMMVVRDAVMGFDMPREQLSAPVIFDVTIAHLNSDFAKIIGSDAIMAAS